MAFYFSTSSLGWPSITGGLQLQVAFNYRFYGIYVFFNDGMRFLVKTNLVLVVHEILTPSFRRMHGEQKLMTAIVGLFIFHKTPTNRMWDDFKAWLFLHLINRLLPSKSGLTTFWEIKSKLGAYQKCDGVKRGGGEEKIRNLIVFFRPNQTVWNKFTKKATRM